MNKLIVFLLIILIGVNGYQAWQLQKLSMALASATKASASIAEAAKKEGPSAQSLKQAADLLTKSAKAAKEGNLGQAKKYSDEAFTILKGQSKDGFDGLKSLQENVEKQISHIYKPQADNKKPGN